MPFKIVCAFNLQVNPMWHYLFAIIYIFLGITSVTGKVRLPSTNYKHSTVLSLNHSKQALRFINILNRQFIGATYFLQNQRTSNTSQFVCHEFGVFRYGIIRF